MTTQPPQPSSARYREVSRVVKSISSNPAGITATRSLWLVVLAVAALGAHADRALARTQGWSRPVATLHGVDQSFGSVSCPTSSFCVAVVQAAGNTRAYALVYRRHRWGHAVQIARGDQLQPDFHVACASSRFCEAVDTNGFVVRYDGHRWTKAFTIAGFGGSVVSSIACPARRLCVAVAYDGSVATYHGRSWTSATFLGPVGSTTFNAVSCSSATSCVAVGPADNGSGAAYGYNGAAWSSVQTFATVGSVYGLSCPTAAFCMAVDDGGGTEAFAHGLWQPPVHTGHSHSHVACSASYFCITDDTHGYRVFTGSGWSQPAALPTGPELDAVSCPTKKFCAAVGAGKVMTLHRPSNP